MGHAHRQSVTLGLAKHPLNRHWSFSGLATIVRIVLMYYLNLEKFLNLARCRPENHARRSFGIAPEVLENY